LSSCSPNERASSNKRLRALGLKKLQQSGGRTAWPLTDGGGLPSSHRRNAHPHEGSEGAWAHLCHLDSDSLDALGGV